MRLNEEKIEKGIEEFKKRIPSKRRIAIIFIGILLLIIAFSLKGRIYHDLEQNEILFVKEIGSGHVDIYKSAGWKWVMLGESTVIKKSYTFWFSAKPDQGAKEDQSIKARFNDNGHGNISGSIRIVAPLDDKNLMDIYSQYKTQEAINHEIVRTTLEKAVYFAGPLMSSTESASTKRNMLLSYIEDQAQYGIYKTVSEEIKTKDPVTGTEKTVTQVRLVADDKSPNNIARHEESLLAHFGFKSSNLSINDIKYDDEVEKQIKTQRDSIMAVQVAIANSKKAEQDALTAVKNGEAAAAKAKWDQEVLRATEVTKAEQKRDVAQLNMKAAEFYKQQQILEGQGDAEKRRLVMAADGALEIKLKYLESILGRFAQEFGKQKWVPEIQMGGSASGVTGGAAINMMDMLTLQTAKMLGVDISMKPGAAATKK